jgi:hypothetical protein
VQIHAQQVRAEQLTQAASELFNLIPDVRRAIAPTNLHGDFLAAFIRRVCASATHDCTTTLQIVTHDRLLCIRIVSEHTSSIMKNRAHVTV